MKPIPRRGFATFTALALLSLVATALATLTLTFAADARRTARESTDAQLRQLLFVAATQARETVDRGESPTAPVVIPLPPALSTEGAQIVLHFNSTDKTTKADARFRSSHASTEIQK